MLISRQAWLLWAESEATAHLLCWVVQALGNIAIAITIAVDFISGFRDLCKVPKSTGYLQESSDQRQLHF